MSPRDLLKINVNDHTEKKNGLTYLSWAWAWAEVLKVDSAATFEVQTFHNKDGVEMPYMDVNGTGMVWVTVTVFNKPMTCMLPVMNHRNQPIQNPDAFQVNTAIMRCMTKAVALHGLSLYIYAGEDLPEDDEKIAPSMGTTAPMGELTRKEDGPKYEKIITKTAPKKTIQPTEWDNSDESRKLFADGMIMYTAHCTSVASLNSYWKSNELQLDSLKVTHPPLYEEVLTRFKTLKQQLRRNQMSDYEAKPDTGSLFATQSKKTPKSPDYWGTIAINMKDLTNVKTENGLTVVKLSGWKKVAKNGKTYLSLAIDRYVPQQQGGVRQENQAQEFPADDSDIPF